MRKAIMICGSGNRDGTSQKACTVIQSELLGMGYDVSFFEPAYMQISHCMDCNGCRSGKCVITDDMNRIYDAFADSELMIVCAPIHFSGPSSAIKTAMDRFQVCWYDRVLSHPSKFIACLCGGSAEPNFQPTESIFKAFCITAGMEYRGTLEIAHTDAGVPDLESKVRSFISEKV